MNYRHHFHAGNFADLAKHAALLAVLARLQEDRSPLLVIDTHAGAGGYWLQPPYVTEGEGSAARRLAGDPEVPAPLRRLRDSIREEAGGLFYPGSPALVAQALRPDDRLLACELREDDFQALAARFEGDPRLELRKADGYAAALDGLRGGGARALVLIDPPYERADDYDRLVDLLAAGLAARPQTVFLVWLPLKDLETFDRLLRAVEALHAPRTIVAEVRLRPLKDPMRMNGCALLLVHAPAVSADLESVCTWVAEAFGEPGGGGRVRPLQP